MQPKQLPHFHLMEARQIFSHSLRISQTLTTKEHFAAPTVISNDFGSFMEHSKLCQVEQKAKRKEAKNVKEAEEKKVKDEQKKIIKNAEAVIQKAKKKQSTKLSQ